ncbi:hypothetical protein R8510_04703 [Ralstonia chuxiongensis]|nr:hypothetical protein R8510_04703 [Ralstonia chuxiongensis]
MAQQSEAGPAEQQLNEEQSQDGDAGGQRRSEPRTGQVVPPLADEDADNQQADPRAE